MRGFIGHDFPESAVHKSLDASGELVFAHDVRGDP